MSPESLKQQISGLISQVRQSDIGRRMLSGAFWSLSGSLVAQGLMLLTSIIIARILGKNIYGELGIIRSTVNMFTVFAGFGLGLTTTRYVAELYRSDKERTGRIIGLTSVFALLTSLVIAGGVLPFAGYIANHTLNAPHLAPEIRISTLILFFGAMNGAQAGILAGFEAFRSIAKNNFLTGILSVPLQVGLTYFLGLQGAIVGLALHLCLLFILHSRSVKKTALQAGISIRFGDVWSEWPILYRFSLPSLLSGILVTPVLWICNTMLVNIPDGYGEMAVYDAANQWRSAILFIPATLSQIALPLLAGSRQNSQKFFKILKLNILLVALIATLMSGVVALFSGKIMNLYGTGFSGGSLVLVFLAVSTIMFAVSDILGKALAGQGRMWIGFAVNAIWALVMITSTRWLLDKGMGALGMAVAGNLAYLALILLLLIIVNKSYRSGTETTEP